MSQPKDIDWNDLRYFLAAARAKTLAGAARTVGVEHSTISRRLTALERTLDAALLTRSPDGLTLTALGEEMLSRAEAVERAVLALLDGVTVQKARVRLAAPSGYGKILTPHLARFHAEHPGVTIELLGGSRMVDLKRNEADLAIRIGTSTDEDLITKKIGEAEWSLYGSETYLSRRPAPSDPRNLAGHDLLGYEASLAGVPGAKWIEEHGKGANIVMRCREVIDMTSACVAGLGLAVLPCGAGDTEPSLRRCTSEVLGSRNVSLVYRKESLMSPQVKAVIGWVVELFAVK